MTDKGSNSSRILWKINVNNLTSLWFYVNGSFVFLPFVLIGCSLNIQMHTCSIHHAPYSLLYEAVFELKEAGFKLDVTSVGPKLTQSVTAIKHIFSFLTIL